MKFSIFSKIHNKYVYLLKSEENKEKGQKKLKEEVNKGNGRYEKCQLKAKNY